MLGPNIIQETKEKVSLIRQRMLVTQCKQRSHADKHRCELEFQVYDKIYLKVLPSKRCNKIELKREVEYSFRWPFEVVKKKG